ncbi:unnamed protein product [Miscanthus lutarioriparius]|uniref:F-box domain-containing protein n=1 Tax=Miscanthus lutarioriparius TaxID=422564 RepID=A0A811QGP5_9POAL|nr:unnamed protein product [Miscanthus lutarioriparius]
MDSDDSTAALAGGGGDRLSKLGDATLGHVLSFLPADEAARAAALSRRWRYVFAHVHTVSLDEPEPQPDSDDDSDYGGCYSPGYGPCCNVKLVPPFVNRVSAALLGRLRLGQDVELPSMRERMKEINFVHYQGGMAQRMLAKFLLCNAPAVDEVCGEFASGPLFVQDKLMEEIKGWVMNKSANLMFF